MTVIEIAHGDITRQRADAIVNAANSSLLDGGGGADGAIYERGGPAILEACRILRATSLPNGLSEGAAVATTAGELPATWVIHTVGPRYSSSEDRSEVLQSCYRRSLAIADELGAQTVALPLISSGRWPKQDAVTQAVAAVRAARTNVRVVKFVVSDRAVADLLRRAVDLFRPFTPSVEARPSVGPSSERRGAPSTALTVDQTEDDEDDPGLPPALMALIHLDPGGHGLLTAHEVATVCGYDRDAVLEYLKITQEREIEWRKFAETAIGEGDLEEADACEYELRAWARTYQSLRSALRVIALPDATRAARAAAKQSPAP
ncbi:O-acetyl-ADP-ribose deacetylase [Rhodococcus sp. NPDC049939]|uniref:O-acetyl-ADP-ribose deacetylase n=1 Tax=Rhodococcus sp. NPDC049939 TaxID=3155511 RepID=UPI00340FFD45